MISAEDISGNKANSDIIEEDIEEAPSQIIDLGESTYEFLIGILIIIIIIVLVVIIFLHKRRVKKQLFSKGQTVKPKIFKSQKTEYPLNAQSTIQSPSVPNFLNQTQMQQQPQKTQSPIISKTENSSKETTNQSSSKYIQQKPQFAQSTKLLPPMDQNTNKKNNNLNNIFDKDQTQNPSKETTKIN